ncbi:MAG: MucBP domain-containing protein [Clostridia bacterium]|nr:MucBP domain-containing protein [Clostridia bacterium]
MRKQKMLALLLCAMLLLTAAAPALAASKVTVTVKYVTGDKNVKIADTERITGVPGAYFQVDLKDISGYTFIGFTHNTMNSFVFPEKDVTLLAHYAKQDGITVKYVDEKGNKLGASKTISGREGQGYTVDTPYFAGYTFLRVDDPNNGVIRADSKTIKVVYRASSASSVVPVSGQMVHLRVQSVDQGTGAVLTLLENADKPYGTHVDISNYRHTVQGYQFTGVTVNGVKATSSDVALTRDTTIVYYYQTTSHWTQPVTHDATLLVRGVDESTGRVFREFYNNAVSYGSAMALNAPNIQGYVYDYCTVTGSSSDRGVVTVYNDTVITYFYKPVYYGGSIPVAPVVYGNTAPVVPVVGGDVPVAVVSNSSPAIGTGAIPVAVVGN